MQKKHKNTPHSKHSWNVKVTYHKYENDIQRDLAYKTWAETFLHGLSNKVNRNK